MSNTHHVISVAELENIRAELEQRIAQTDSNNFERLWSLRTQLANCYTALAVPETALVARERGYYNFRFTPCQHPVRTRLTAICPRCWQRPEEVLP